MAKYKLPRYGVCHGVNLFQFFIIPTPIIPEISTGIQYIDLGISVGISQIAGFVFARIVGWHDEEQKLLLN